MATGNPYVGRLEGIGIGIEATPGTSVAPQTWMRWLDQSIQNKTLVAENESAIGVAHRVSDSAVVQKWAEGTIGGKVTATTVGYLLLGYYGSVSTGTASGGIYPHTFSASDSSVPTALTITHNTPLKKQRFSYGTIENLEFSAEAGGWVQVSAGVKARPGVTSSDTVAFTDEVEFTSKQITVKTAANTAGLGAATAMSIKSVKLQLERSSEKFDSLGTDDTPEFDRLVREAKGEFVIRYTDTAYEDAFLANTAKALEIKLANGTTDLTFTAGQVRFRELEKSSDKDQIVTQTIQFFCEYSTTDSADVTAVLHNDTATYEAA